MSHGPPTEWKEEKSEGFKRKLGLIMFAFYTALYFIFVLLCVLSPKLVSAKVLNLNLAVTYGFALIITAIILALLYNFFCARKERSDIEHK
jgi:uncharacterized membrane protein (DUF485 family)